MSGAMGFARVEAGPLSATRFSGRWHTRRSNIALVHTVVPYGVLANNRSGAGAMTSPGTSAQSHRWRQRRRTMRRVCREMRFSGCGGMMRSLAVFEVLELFVGVI